MIRTSIIKRGNRSSIQAERQATIQRDNRASLQNIGSMRMLVAVAEDMRRLTDANDIRLLTEDPAMIRRLVQVPTPIDLVPPSDTYAPTYYILGF